MIRLVWILMAVFVVMPRSFAKDDVVEMDGTTIRGTTELPKVLYIVPWKKSQLGTLLIQPGASMFGEELAPLDRDVFKRQLKFYEILHSSGGSKPK